MYETKVLERWLRQIKSGELNPEAVGFGSDREKAIEKIRSELNKLAYNKWFISLK